MHKLWKEDSIQITRQCIREKEIKCEYCPALFNRIAVTLVTYIWLLSSMLHYYIDRLYSSFFPLMFSNVSSNHSLEIIYSHIGCICLIFLHCGFLNAPSNCLHERMHNRIGCICLTFLHCAFSNVFSNGLPEKRHSHIGYIFLLFATVRFQMCSQIACAKRSIVTQAAFV